MNYISEFGGGLGDIILNCHSDRRYMTICNLPEGDTATVFIQSPNPFAHELFTHCPSKNRLKVVSTGWFWSDDPEELKNLRTIHGMPPETMRYEVPQSTEPVRWYPRPLDQPEILRAALDPFVIIESAAGDSVRTMPIGFLEAIVGSVLASRYVAVLVGRFYDHGGRTTRTVKQQPKVIDSIDRLSVPGTLQLIRLARGVICTHSAIHHAAAKDKQRNFCLYPQEMQVLPDYLYEPAMAATEEHGMFHWWGIRQPWTTSCTFEDFTPEQITAWLEML